MADEKGKKEAYICAFCKKQIYVGDEIVEFHQHSYHPRCVERLIENNSRTVTEREAF